MRSAVSSRRPSCAPTRRCPRHRPHPSRGVTCGAPKPATGARAGKPFPAPRSVAETSETALEGSSIQCAGSIPSLKGGLFTEHRRAFVEQYRIRGYEVGPDRQTTLPALADLLQEAAGNHAICMWGKTEAGFAAHPIMVERGLVFAMTRLQMQVDRYPAWGDVIEIETWVLPQGRISTRRDWIIRDVQTGETIGRATSTWVMIDAVKRKMVRIPDEAEEFFKVFGAPKDRHAIPSEETRRKLPAMSETTIAGPVRVARQSHVDMNGHVNNVDLIIWAMDCLPDQMHESKTLTEIEIDFKAESNAGDEVSSSYCSDESQDGLPDAARFIHSLKRKDDDKVVELLQLRTTWT